MILVTGCAGFIGSKVAQSLLDQGREVVGVDNLNDAYDVRLKRWRLAALQGRQGFSFHQMDIAQRDFAARLAEARGGGLSGVEAVINLAARAGVRQSVTQPWDYYEANLFGTLNLLEMCRATETPKFVLASTSSLYGNPGAGASPGTPGASQVRRFSEDLPTDRPLSPYAASKKAAETLCHAYSHLHGLDVTILRYFTVYGPAGRPDMSVFRFVRWIAEGEPLILHGDGFQLRDFTYVDDIARGTMLALRPAPGYEVFNLGSDHPVPLRDVLARIEGLLGKKADIRRTATHRADVPATWADIERARTELGWQPESGLDTGLERCVAWYRDNRDWAREVDLGETSGA